MTHSESIPVGIIKYSHTKDGVKLYDARIETVCYDHSPRNPSLPVIVCHHVAYNLTHEQAVKHIRSFGFDGKIENF